MYDYSIRSVFTIILLSYITATGWEICPDTVWQRVTFYDFHADGSNPEFNPDPHFGGLYQEMVMQELDNDRKPVRNANPSSLYFNYSIGKWFRPWQPGDYQVPVYASDGSGRFIETQSLSHDTAFINIVIQDSLPFVHSGNGVYQYSNNEFFLLDGRGFGTEPRGMNPHSHNYSFTMELHIAFKYRLGLFFEFRGDDDVWVFVDNRLVLDLGGIHSSLEGRLSLDDIPGLLDGEIYDFNLFFCERHVIRSTIHIESNFLGECATTILHEAVRTISNTTFNESTAARYFDLRGRAVDCTRSHEIPSILLKNGKATQPPKPGNFQWTHFLQR